MALSMCKNGQWRCFMLMIGVQIITGWMMQWTKSSTRNLHWLGIFQPCLTGQLSTWIWETTKRIKPQMMANHWIMKGGYRKKIPGRDRNSVVGGSGKRTQYHESTHMRAHIEHTYESTNSAHIWEHTYESTHVRAERRKADPKTGEAHLVRACAAETHMAISQKPFCEEIYTKNAGPASDHHHHHHLNWIPGRLLLP